MENINKPGGENFAGIELVYFAPREDFSYIAKPLEAAIQENILFKAGKDWYSAEAIRGTIEYIEGERNGDDGVYYRPELKFIVAKQTSALNNSLQLLNNSELLLLFKDYNESWYLVGNQENFLMKDQRLFSTGAQPADRNQISLTFNNDGMPDPACHYTGITPV